MKVMVMVKATPSSEAGEMPSQELMQAMGKFNEELVAAGIMKAGEGLKPSSEAVRVHFRGAERTVTDGPFAETKELIAGYWIWEVESLAEAVEWVRRCPNPMTEESDIDIRPIFGIEDFAACDPSGEIRDAEHRLTERLAMQQASVTPYLFFGGRCGEALEFYQEALGAEVGMAMRFNESPEPCPESELPPGYADKVMHAELKVGGTTLFASDGCGESPSPEHFRLALTVPTEEDARRVFDRLAAEGKVDMPLAKTFWSPCYGMVTDRFNVGWMVMVPGPQPA
ncbi:hypothetical protein Pla108_27620 [Botrimarina colliarenosi]|uniref:YCII-related domain protein n=1 Tax=Botrimarina colliarenosi TaxID=2528001 RepID=A0A5C6ACV0_9BACT|nr:YciI family protein [Botrimarina colliarenosi]TWT96985.1 hypothetical protein Pla108_27620 [Botrimarina colliarenosi]